MSTLSEAKFSLPKAFTTLIPPSCSSTSVVIVASASFTLKETSIAFSANLAPTHKTPGIESRTTDPKGRLMLSKVILRINNKKIFADAKGAIAYARRT